jgi:hypothetical protein
MSLHRDFDSKVHLMSKDERFRVNWRNGYLPDVTSDSLLHRKRTVWPDFNAPDDFIELIIKLENILKVKFERNFEVHAYSLDMTGVNYLSQWLSPLTDTVTFHLGTLYGEAPNKFMKSDNRNEKGGITLCVQSEK